MTATPTFKIARSLAAAVFGGLLLSPVVMADESVTHPASPSELTVVTVAADQVRLYWHDNSTVERGFYILRSADGVHWDKIDTLQANSGEYLDAGLNAASRYVYKVAAFNAEGEVANFSNKESVITAPDEIDQFEVKVADVFMPYM